MQDCSNSIDNALELLQSCTKPSIYKYSTLLVCRVIIDNLQRDAGWNSNQHHCLGGDNTIPLYQIPVGPFRWFITSLYPYNYTLDTEWLPATGLMSTIATRVMGPIIYAI